MSISEWADRNKHNPIIIMLLAFLLAGIMEVACPSLISRLHNYSVMEDFK